MFLEVKDVGICICMRYVFRQSKNYVLYTKCSVVETNIPRQILANKNWKFADNKIEIVISMHYSLQLPKNNHI